MGLDGEMSGELWELMEQVMHCMRELRQSNMQNCVSELQSQGPLGSQNQTAANIYALAFISSSRLQETKEKMVLILKKDR